MSYQKHNFQTGGTIQASPFNAMENQIAANEAAIAGKYAKPANGIPKTDLASAVQASLGKADSALQAVPDTYRTSAAQDTIDAGKLAKPSGNGTSGQLLQTNGDGTTAWVNAPSGGGGGSSSVTVDATLSASGQAADAKATGDALAVKYEKPSGGIPKTDLASAVQTSLGKADTALQAVPNTYRTASDQDTIDSGKYTKPSGGIPASDLASAVQTSLGKADSALQAVPNTYRTSAAQDVIDAAKYEKPSGGIPMSDIAPGFKDAFADFLTELITLLPQIAYTEESNNGVATISAADALLTALGSSGSGGSGSGGATLLSITASLSLGGAKITTANSLNDLKQYLTVTGRYSDNTTQTITGYTLSGTLERGTSTISVQYGSRSTTFTVAVYAPLPSGYTELQYVAADGASWLDTGLTQSQVVKAVYNVLVTRTTHNNGNHILSGGSLFFPYLRFNSSGKILNAKYLGTEPSNSAYEWNMNQRYTLEGFPDVKVDGTTVYTLAAGSSANSNDHLWVFNYYQSSYASNVGGAAGNYAFHGNLYSMKIYGANDTLLRDFVPCKNGSDVAGLYDLVGESFYPSATSTALTAGEVA